MFPLPYRTVAGLALAGLACGDGASSAQPERPAPAPAAVAVTADAAPAAAGCERQPFATSLPIAEASGAAWLDGDTLLVVGDSGTSGQAIEIRGDTGEVVWHGKMPLDRGATDDLEGLARVGETVYGITSSGYMRAWRRSRDGWRQVEQAYPIEPPGAGALVCSGVNCGFNIEGLCLRDPRPDDGCAGFVAAKRDGRLYCLIWRGDRLVADRGRSIEVTAGRLLSGCSFTDDGRLLAATNLFGGNAIYEIRGHERPSEARAVLVARAGPGFGEAIAAAPGGRVYRFSDTARAPSGVEKFVCR
jgi:hypothetical protein